ncbi:MAG: hypothetical protein JWR80_8524 [Bradyrhizobium sp.]|nr:hypothetical protein [Bradyrhizobium sp.]
MDNQYAKFLYETRAHLGALTKALPKALDLRAVSKYKTVGNTYALRDSLMWRMEELTRSALALFESDCLVAAALMTRGVMETTAATFYLDKLVTDAIAKGVTENLRVKITGFLTGSRVWEDIGGAINVLTMIDAVDKRLPGYRKHYEFLCEYAHPNWTGTHGAYATIDKERFVVTYEAVGRNPENTRKVIVGKLSGSVQLFVGVNRFLGEQLAAFAEAVAAFHAQNGEGEH